MIEDNLRAKFGDEGAGLMPAITELWDGEANLAMNRAIGAAATLADVRRAMAKAVAKRKQAKKRQPSPNS
jgi:hypothetical protein